MAGPPAQNSPPMAQSTQLCWQVPTAPLAYWKVKNSWGPAFGEGGYARLLFGNNCLRGVVQPFVNSTREG